MIKEQFNERNVYMRSKSFGPARPRYFIQRYPNVLQGVMCLDEFLIKKGVRKGRVGKRDSPKKAVTKAKTKNP